MTPTSVNVSTLRYAYIFFRGPYELVVQQVLDVTPILGSPLPFIQIVGRLLHPLDGLFQRLVDRSTMACLPQQVLMGSEGISKTIIVFGSGPLHAPSTTLCTAVCVLNMVIGKKIGCYLCELNAYVLA